MRTVYVVQDSYVDTDEVRVWRDESDELHVELFQDGGPPSTVCLTDAKARELAHCILRLSRET